MLTKNLSGIPGQPLKIGVTSISANMMVSLGFNPAIIFGPIFPVPLPLIPTFVLSFSHEKLCEKGTLTKLMNGIVSPEHTFTSGVGVI